MGPPGTRGISGEVGPEVLQISVVSSLSDANVGAYLESTQFVKL